MKHFAAIAKYLEEKKVEGWLHERLAHAAGAEGEILGRLIARLNPSANTLREMLQLSDDLCIRDETTMCALFAAPEITDILNNDKLGFKVKQQRIKLLLAGRRYPQAAKIKEEIARLQSELAGLFAVTVDVPEDLEGDELRISLRFKNGNELRNLANRLEAMGGSPALERIFSLLKGSSA